MIYVAKNSCVNKHTETKEWDKESLVLSDLSYRHFQLNLLKSKYLNFMAMIIIINVTGQICRLFVSTSSLRKSLTDKERVSFHYFPDRPSGGRCVRLRNDRQHISKYTLILIYIEIIMVIYYSVTYIYIL